MSFSHQRIAVTRHVRHAAIGDITMLLSNIISCLVGLSFALHSVGVPEQGRYLIWI
jgi:hypothetical protein